ncbi:MAG: HIT domain-containing protein [Nitriliruptoraceae bacterium]
MTDTPHGLDVSGQQPDAAPDALQRLWAPWRYSYVAKPDDTPADKPAGCPFCVLPAKPASNDAASLILHRGQHNFIMLNAYPYNPGHLMVLPYTHTASLPGLDDDTATELFQLTRRSVALLETVLACTGVNLGMNLGAHAGAGIAEHLHLHAVPRWSGDTNFMTVAGSTRVLPRALDDIYDELAASFNT